MPVEAHEIHQSVRHGADKRYGCWNLPESLNHRMSDRCRFDMSLSDPWCEGCEHRGKGEQYDAMVRMLGT